MRAAMWTLAIPPSELVARTTLVYVLFVLALRLSGKRELGQLTIFDLALVLLAANALQPAITGPDASIPGAAIILATIFALNRLAAIGRRRSRVVRRILELPPRVIGEHGRWIPEALAREGLDDEDLAAALREHGLASAAEMRLAVLEQDGTLSIVPTGGDTIHVHARRRRYRRHP
jgi:uncharacterized membrane protein YcaP (DUF421 family)